MFCTNYSQKLLLLFACLLAFNHVKCQDCDCVKDTFRLVFINSAGSNGRPYLNTFVFNPNEYPSVLKGMDTCNSMASLLNFCASQGVLMFDYPVPGQPDNAKCDSFPSKTARGEKEELVLKHWMKLWHKFKAEKTLIYPDSTMAGISSVRVYLVLWKNKSKADIDMLHYSSGMYFSEDVHYNKAYYYEIRDL